MVSSSTSGRKNVEKKYHFLLGSPDGFSEEDTNTRTRDEHSMWTNWKNEELLWIKSPTNEMKRERQPWKNDFNKFSSERIPAMHRSSNLCQRHDSLENVARTIRRHSLQRNRRIAPTWLKSWPVPVVQENERLQPDKDYFWMISDV